MWSLLSLFLFLSFASFISRSTYIKWKCIWSLSLQLNWIANHFLVLQCPTSSYLVAHLLSLLQSNLPPFSSWNSPSFSMVELFFLGSFFFLPRMFLNIFFFFFCIAESFFRYQFITSEKYSVILSAVPLPPQRIYYYYGFTYSYISLTNNLYTSCGKAIFLFHWLLSESLIQYLAAGYQDKHFANKYILIE